MGHHHTPGTAAVLSLVIPGVGQFCAFWQRIFWLIVTPGLWIGSGGLLGWICHVIAARKRKTLALERSTTTTLIWRGERDLIAKK